MRRVQVTSDGGVAHVRLTRADKHNGLDSAMFTELTAAGVALASRRDVRAVVLSGDGPSFCAGLDFASFLADASSMGHLLGRDEGTDANRAQRIAWVWRELPMPVVAALHGAVYGGGLQIALAADVRIRDPDARLSVMELRYGLIPDMGISATLFDLVRPDVAAELIYTARIVSGAEAAALGLVTRVDAEPLAAALDLAGRIAAHNPDAIRAAKRLLSAAPGLPIPKRLALEAELQTGLLGTPNQLEAIAAVFGKRPGQFTDG